MSKKQLTQSYLKSVVKYDKSTGIFTRIGNRGGRKAGSIAGTVERNNGYVRLRIDGKDYRAQRLAFLYVYGYFPEYQVDHRNGDRADNRWSNLRHVTSSCNMQNQTKQVGRSSRFIGVSENTRNSNWSAHIKIDGRKMSLGNHVDEISAALARVTSEDQCAKWKCNHQDANRVLLRKLGWCV